MKHINEPPPDLTERRPDVPLRLVAAVERALEKDPSRRFQSMDAFASELRQCLVDMSSADEERTFIARSPVLKQSRPHRARAARRRWPLVALVLLAGAAAIAASVIVLTGSPGKGKAPSRPVAGSAVPLVGVTSYDPTSDGGDGSEDPGEVGLATDGDPQTFWHTDIYSNQNFGNLKPGVGLVLDARHVVTLKQITVTTDTPGFPAKIQAGSAPSGTFSDDSTVRTVNGRTTFPLRGAKARYYVVWLTGLPPGRTVHVNEVTARGK
jgi:putative peptidoglycan lipid II flippase